MKKLTFILVFSLLIILGCTDPKHNREVILGRSFTNSEVVSIDIVQIEHPMLGGIIETIKLSESEKEKFLTDFDQLEEKGISKCMSDYVIRLQMKTDTLRLKVCENMVANRANDMYYGLKNNENIIAPYLKK